MSILSFGLLSQVNRLKKTDEKTDLLHTLLRRLWISVTGRSTAAKTMAPNFLFSVSGVI
jgi:hypothetical protein